MRRYQVSLVGSGLLLALMVALLSLSVFSTPGQALAQTTTAAPTTADTTTSAATTGAATTSAATTSAVTTVAVTTVAVTTDPATTSAITTSAATTTDPGTTVAGASSSPGAGGQGGVSGLPSTGVGNSANSPDQTIPVIFLIALALAVIISSGVMIIRTNRKS